MFIFISKYYLDFFKTKQNRKTSKMSMLKGIYVVAAKRTAFGKFGGKLKDMSATDLQVIANKAAIEQSKLSPEKIDSSIVGNIIHVRYLSFLSPSFRDIIFILFYIEFTRCCIYCQTRCSKERYSNHITSYYY